VYEIARKITSKGIQSMGCQVSLPICRELLLIHKPWKLCH